MTEKKRTAKPTKKLGRPPDGKEAKKSYNVYLEPTDKDAIVKKHGSLTKAIETTIPNKTAAIQTTIPKRKK